METMEKALVTNRRVGEDLGVSHATISRIRSGDRVPSLALMGKVEKLTRWKLDRQVRARLEGKYADQFERVLTQHYDPSLVVGPVASSGAVG